MNFSKRLQMLRLDKEMSQKELAKNLNLAKTTISSYETEKASPSLSVLISIAGYFNVSTDYLLGITDINTGYPNDPNPQRILLILPKNATPELRKTIECNAKNTMIMFEKLLNTSNK